MPKFNKSLSAILAKKEIIKTVFQAYNLGEPYLTCDRRDRLELVTKNPRPLGEGLEISLYLSHEFGVKVNIREATLKMNMISVDAPKEEINQFFGDPSRLLFKKKDLTTHEKYAVDDVKEKLQSRPSQSALRF